MPQQAAPGAAQGRTFQSMAWTNARSTSKIGSCPWYCFHTAFTEPMTWFMASSRPSAGTGDPPSAMLRAVVEPRWSR